MSVSLPSWSMAKARTGNGRHTHLVAVAAEHGRWAINATLSPLCWPGALPFARRLAAGLHAGNIHRPGSARVCVGGAGVGATRG